jgi:hypothetical protein
MIIKNIEDLLEHLLIWYDGNKEYYPDIQYSEMINKFKEEQGFLIKEAKEVVQRERVNEETTIEDKDQYNYYPEDNYDLW